MYLSNIKFKNMYIVDLYTKQVIFDMMSLRVFLIFIQKNEKFKKYYKNEKLWQEIMYHSDLLMNCYGNEIGSITYDPIDLNLRVN